MSGLVPAAFGSWRRPLLRTNRARSLVEQHRGGRTIFRRPGGALNVICVALKTDLSSKAESAGETVGEGVGARNETRVGLTGERGSDGGASTSPQDTVPPGGGQTGGSILLTDHVPDPKTNPLPIEPNTAFTGLVNGASTDAVIKVARCAISGSDSDYASMATPRPTMFSTKPSSRPFATFNTDAACG